MFSRMPAQSFARQSFAPALWCTSAWFVLAVATAGLSFSSTMPTAYAQSPASSAQGSSAPSSSPGPASNRSKTNRANTGTNTGASNGAASNTAANTAEYRSSVKRATDWWVPGILAGSVMVGGAAVIVLLKRSAHPALATEAPEPLRYIPPNHPKQNSPQNSPQNPQAKPNQSTQQARSIVTQASGPIETAQAKMPQPTDLKRTVDSVTSVDSAVGKIAALKTDKTESEKSETQKAEPFNPPSVHPPSEHPELVQPQSGAAEQGAIVSPPSTTTRIAKVSVIDLLLQELRSNDPAKRQKAVWELGRSGDSRAVQPLVDLLLDSDSQQRSLVLSALSEISTRTLKPLSRALAISMQDENADVRKNAIRDLTRIYDTLTNISQLLHGACEDPDPEVQETAKWAISQINRIKSPIIQGAGRSVSQPESLN